MTITPKTTIHTLLKEYPFLLDFLAEYRSEFAKLRNPVLRNTVGRVATLRMAATMGETPLEKLLNDIRDAIQRQTGERVEIGAGDVDEDVQRMETLKGIIAELHGGGDFEVLKDRFARLIRDADPSEVARMEQQLIQDGLPVEEVQRLCDVHVAIFKDALDRSAAPETLPGHPVHTFIQENRALGEVIESIRTLLGALPEREDAETCRQIEGEILRLKEVDKHYLRKENQLFPFLEKYGITGPSQVMWAIHDDIRARLKKALEAAQRRERGELMAAAPQVMQMMEDMFYKEEHILLPMSLGLLGPAEWGEIQRGEGATGYALIRPGSVWKPELEQVPVAQTETKNVLARLPLDTGLLTLDQVNLILTHLPVELSFVDENDEVRYYSQTPEKIFPRSPGVIGRKVQNCHPPKSLDVVNRILTDFRSGKRDVAEFWINLQGRMVYIRYFAVRDHSRQYRGALEVVQDVTGIQALTGERRLMDE
jgi:PAS domain S-box-containing protein